VRFFRNGVRVGRLDVGFNWGWCSKENRTHVLLLDLTWSDSSAPTVSVQFWRAFFWIQFYLYGKGAPDAE